jgi:hypothetical protein
MLLRQLVRRSHHMQNYNLAVVSMAMKLDACCLLTVFENRVLRGIFEP